MVAQTPKAMCDGNVVAHLAIAHANGLSHAPEQEAGPADCARRPHRTTLFAARDDGWWEQRQHPVTCLSPLTPTAEHHVRRAAPVPFDVSVSACGIAQARLTDTAAAPNAR
jgi:hypothetical protein